jgi:hypothetical protein
MMWPSGQSVLTTYQSRLLPNPLFIVFFETTTPWSWVLREKLTVAQPVFSIFYGTRRFITVFTRARHWSPSWARSFQPIPFNPISQRSILILSSHLCVGLLSCLFANGFPSKLYMQSSSSHPCYMSCLFHPPWLGQSNCMWRKVQVMKLLILQFSQTAYYFIPLWSKYSSLHPLLKYPQSMSMDLK